MMRRASGLPFLLGSRVPSYALQAAKPLCPHNEPVWLADGFVARVLAAGLIGPSVALMALAGTLYLALRNSSDRQPYADV